MTRWFADSLLEALESVPGSFEREHVIALLRRARRVRLADDVTRATAETVRHACDTVERHLGYLHLRAPATWVEFSHAARLAAFAPGVAPGAAMPLRDDMPETVGCLVACDPENPHRVAVFVAWRLADGAIHHSYALLHWDRTEFLSLASAAESKRGRPDTGAAAERLLGAASAAIPPGFLSELEIWQEHAAANDDARKDAAILQTLRDASGEHLFMVAALLMIESSAVRLDAATEGEGDARDTGDALPDAEAEAHAVFDADGIERDPPSTARLVPESWLWPWQRGGFREPRTGSKLVWARPQASRQ